jgi:hypothetical protein
MSLFYQGFPIPGTTEDAKFRGFFHFLNCFFIRNGFLTIKNYYNKAVKGDQSELISPQIISVDIQKRFLYIS